MDDELERFKRLVNLTEMVVVSGYQLESGQRATASRVTMRHPGTDDKIVIRRSGDGHWTYFSVRDDRDNGSVIDLLQRRCALGLGAVRKELRAWLREERPRPAAALSPNASRAAARPGRRGGRLRRGGRAVSPDPRDHRSDAPGPAFLSAAIASTAEGTSSFPTARRTIPPSSSATR